jgi:hypothetical protein
MKHYDQKQLGYERVYLILGLFSSLRKSGQELTQGRNLMQRPWKDAAYWLAPHSCPACFLIEPRATNPGVVLPTMGGAPPESIRIIKKMPYIHTCLQPDLTKAFISSLEGSLLSDDSNLCQISIKTVSIDHKYENLFLDSLFSSISLYVWILVVLFCLIILCKDHIIFKDPSNLVQTLY